MNWLRVGRYPEVAFIGRSNVGKSSLVNMVLGRKVSQAATRFAA